MSPIAGFVICLFFGFGMCASFFGYYSHSLSRWRALWLVPFYAFTLGGAAMTFRIGYLSMATAFGLFCLGFSGAFLVPRMLMRRRTRLVAEGKRPPPECPRAPVDLMGQHGLNLAAVDHAYRAGRPTFECQWCQTRLPIERVRSKLIEAWRLFISSSAVFFLMCGGAFLVGWLKTGKLIWEISYLTVPHGLILLFFALRQQRRLKLLEQLANPTGKTA